MRTANPPKPKLLTKLISPFHGIEQQTWIQIASCVFETSAIGIAFYISIYLASRLHFNASLIGLAISCYGIGNFAGGMTGGKLCSHLKAKHVMIASLILQSALFFSLPLYKSIATICCIMTLLGLASYIFKTANTLQTIALNSNNPEKTQIKAINLLYTASNIGIGISAVLISLFADISFTYLFSFAGTITLLLALTHLLTNTKNQDPQQETKKEAKSRTSEPNRIIFSTILMILFGIGLLIAQNRTTYPLYLHHHFSSRGFHEIGLIFALNPIIIILFQTHLTALLTEKNKMLIVGTGILLMGAGFALLSYIPTLSFAVITTLCYTAGEMLFFSSAQYMCYKYSPLKRNGNKIGIFQSTYALSTSIGPLLGGLLYHHIGPTFLWACCGILGLIGFVACYSQRKLAH